MRRENDFVKVFILRLGRWWIQ